MFSSLTKGAFFWDYSGNSYSGLVITEYTEFQFPKERSFILKTDYSHGRGDLRTTTSSKRKPGDRRGRKERVFCIFRVNCIPYITRPKKRVHIRRCTARIISTKTDLF